MLNVDGTLLGNNRTGLLGFDYNRQWKNEYIALKEHFLP
jgi:hypothetical protein